MEQERVFKVSYQLYEIDNGGNMDDPVECEVDGYKDVETLKSETEEVLEKLIADYKIPDGIVVAKMQIERNGEYYDSDSAELTVENGKITGWGEV